MGKRTKSVARILGYRDGIPIVAVWRVPDTIHLIFRCPWCEKIHYHGAGRIDAEFGKGDGHRVEHCVPPIKEGAQKGYILREVEDRSQAGEDIW